VTGEGEEGGSPGARILPAMPAEPTDSTGEPPSATESVIPDIRYTRTHDGSEQRATFFELFFDLVYVFAITQLSHHLLLHLDWTGAAQTTFLGLAVYWAWNYTTWMTNWFDPDNTGVRLVLVFVMLASLLMAVAIPEAFSDHDLLFAVSYTALQVVRNTFVVAVTPRGAFNRNFQQILAWSVLSVPFWVAGALTHGSARWCLWLAALGLDLLAPAVRYWLPGFSRTSMREWDIDPAHFAERFQLLVIIVLGESIVVAGSTAADAGLETAVVLSLGFAFLSAVALWWLYFGQVARSAVRRLTDADVPGQVGRDAYTYLHIPIVAGILLSAVGDELVIAHPHDEMGAAGALVTLGGPALYLLGVVVFGARIGRHQAWPRVAVALVLLAAVPLAAETSGLVVAGISTALLATLVTVDQIGLGRTGFGFSRPHQPRPQGPAT
jgi:low temperature requirement protein LtrA